MHIIKHPIWILFWGNPCMHVVRLDDTCRCNLACTIKFFHFVEKSESPGVRNFFLTLGGQWELVADYLGYTREEVQLILQKFPDSVENQVHTCILCSLCFSLSPSPSLPPSLPLSSSLSIH